MNKEDRIRAFALRCEGATWEEIGKILHYTGSNVALDLQRVVSRGWQRAKSIYPQVNDYINENYEGSIEKFSAAIHVSPTTARSVLVKGFEPSKNFQKKVYEATGFLIPIPEEDEEE